MLSVHAGELRPEFPQGDGHAMAGVRLRNRRERKSRGKKRKSEGICRSLSKRF